MLLYLFFDSLLSSCPKKMDTEKWPKAADSPLIMEVSSGDIAFGRQPNRPPRRMTDKSLVESIPAEC